MTISKITSGITFFSSFASTVWTVDPNPTSTGEHAARAIVPAEQFCKYANHTFLLACIGTRKGDDGTPPPCDNSWMIPLHVTRWRCFYGRGVGGIDARFLFLSQRVLVLIRTAFGEIHLHPVKIDIIE